MNIDQFDWWSGKLMVALGHSFTVTPFDALGKQAF